MVIKYTTKRSKGKTVRISILRNGEVFLHVPRFVPTLIAERFLRSKSDWVLKSVEKVKREAEKAKLFPPKKSKKEIRKEYLEKKEEARKLVNEKLEYWRTFYIHNYNIHFKWNKVAIKNTITRWGSCSSKKNLNFSYKIIQLGEKAQDYLIVHELCHLIQMNHSNKFWELVSLGIQDYKILRKSLKGLK